MKMKFCAVSLSLPPLESGESIGAFQRAIISEEIRVFSKPWCPLIVVIRSKRRWGVMEVVYTSYCQKHV